MLVKNKKRSSIQNADKISFDAKENMILYPIVQIPESVNAQRDKSFGLKIKLHWNIMHVLFPWNE